MNINRLCVRYGTFVLLASAVATASHASAAQAAVPSSTLIAQSDARATAGTISGTVTGTDGRPVAGVRVSAEGAASSTATTAPDGTYAIANIAAGSYLLTFVKTGYATFDESVTVVAGATQTASIALAINSQTSLRQIGRVITVRSGTQLNRSIAATSTLSQQTYVDRGQAQISNVLEELPGVELQRFSSGGGPGANTVASVRGSDPAETQTLIDGHPVSGGPQGNYLIQFLNPLLLSDVEVLKGPGAFGNTIANQVNGTINYRTLEISPTPTLRTLGGYDSYNGSKYLLSFSDTIGKIGFVAADAMTGLPGYNDGPVLSVAANGTPGFGTIPEATATTFIGNSQTFHNHSELLKLNYAFSNASALTLSYFGLHTYADYTGNLTTEEPFKIVGVCPPATASGASGPGTGAGCGPTAGYSGNTSFTNPNLGGLIGKTVYASSVNDNLYQGNFETDNEPFFNAELRTAAGPASVLARFYAASIKRDIDDPDEAFQPVQCDDPTCSAAAIAAAGDLSGAFFQTQSDYLHGADFQIAVPVRDNTFTASYDTHGDRTTACSGGQASPGGAKACSVPSILQSSQTIALRSNIRLTKTIDLQAANYFSHATFVHSRIDPRLGFTFVPNANIIVRASAGSGFVTPSASTAYAVTPHIQRQALNEGAAILPETSFSYDLGSDVKTGSDSKIVFDAYVTRLFNRFSTVTVMGANGGVIGTFNGAKYTSINSTGNQASALEKGLEFTYLLQPRFGVGATAYVNFLRAYAGGSNTALDVKGNPVVNALGTIYGAAADGQQINGYPPTHGRLELNYTSHADLKPAVGATYYGNLNSFNEPAFVLFDANVQAKLQHDIRLGISVQNIFNHDSYRTFGVYNYGPTQPGLFGGSTQNTLYFAPPRQITFTLEHSFGPTGNR